MFEGADLWFDYRGACIEHDLYRPRFLPSSGKRPLLSAVGNWLDNLFAWSPHAKHDDCPNCNPPVAIQSDTGLRPAPYLAPVPVPDYPTHPRPQPAPVPPTPVQVVPVEPSPTPAPAPVQPPRNEIPRPRPSRAPIIDVSPAPAHAPAPAPVEPPRNEIPKLSPPRGPIVELAPEPALPPDPPQADVTGPRNRAPAPGPQLPRNLIPR